MEVSSDGDDCVEAVVVSGCLHSDDLKEICRVFEMRCFVQKEEFLGGFHGQDLAVGRAVLATLEAMGTGDMGMTISSCVGNVKEWLDRGVAGGKHWRAVFAVASLMAAHLASLRGQWKRDLLEPLLEDPAWRDLAATALASFPQERDKHVTNVWPNHIPPLQVPEAFSKFPRTKECLVAEFVTDDDACIIRGFASSWPALQKWRDPSHLRRVIGHRMMPIELGSSYMAEDFEQKLMPFSQYLESVLSCQGAQDEANRVGYLGMGGEVGLDSLTHF